MMHMIIGNHDNDDDDDDDDDDLLSYAASYSFPLEIGNRKLKMISDHFRS
jgi:hypothetical protein